MGKSITGEEFIKKSQEKHGDKYDYSKVVYTKAVEKVIIICKKHGEFLQQANLHLNGSGCVKCYYIKNSQIQRSNTEEFIKRAIEIHRNKYDYSKVKYVNNQTRVNIICKEHGEFLQIPNKHIQGNGCKLCGIKSQTLTRSSNTEEFIKKAKNIHGNLFDYSKVNYKNSNEKVIIICKEHGDFLQTPSGHIGDGGSGCKLCANKNNGIKQRMTNDDFVKKANKKHDNKYDYSKTEYNTYNEKVIIICKEHGEFLQTPGEHLSGCGCSKCGKVYKKTTEEFIKNAKQIHGDTYDYSKTEFKVAKGKVIIICKKHGEFLQDAFSHLKGHGCFNCGLEIITNAKRFTTDEFIEKAKTIHGEETFDYSKTNYTNCKTKIIIICKLHGDFLQTPESHINGVGGCKLCSHRTYSRKSIEYLCFISKLNSITIQHAENDGEFVIPNTRFKADGYCQETNTVYEFHGDYWHGNPKLFSTEEFNKTTKCCFGELYQNTLEREQQIRGLGYNLVVMWEYDWNNINRAIKTLQSKFRSNH